MADEDKNTTSQGNEVQGLKTEMDKQLGAIQAQLKAMNDQHAESLRELASAVKPQKQTQQTRIEDDDLYDAGRLEEKVAATAGRIADSIVARNRELDTTIYNLAQEYPEIQSSPEIQKAVREAQASLPKELRDTATGVEMAVLKAASKAGLVAKSKRPSTVSDEDFSVSRGRGNPDKSAGKSGKGKVDNATLTFARLMGKDINDPDYVKRLEQAASRETFSKYR